MIDQETAERYEKALEVICSYENLVAHSIAGSLRAVAKAALNPPEIMEEVKISTWLCPACFRHLQPDNECAHCKLMPTKFISKIVSAAKRKVTRREEITYYSQYCGMVNYSTADKDNVPCPPNAKVYIEIHE